MLIYSLHPLPPSLRATRICRGLRQESEGRITPRTRHFLSLRHIETKTIHTQTHTLGQFRVPNSNPVHTVALWEEAGGPRERTHADSGNTITPHRKAPRAKAFLKGNHVRITQWSEWQWVTNYLAAVLGKWCVLFERSSSNATEKMKEMWHFLNRASYFHQSCWLTNAVQITNVHYYWSLLLGFVQNCDSVLETLTQQQVLRQQRHSFSELLIGTHERSCLRFIHCRISNSKQQNGKCIIWIFSKVVFFLILN